MARYPLCAQFALLRLAALTCRARVSSFDVLRSILGCVLLTAAVLEGYQLAAGPVIETSFFTSRWFLIGLVEFELILGVWLLIAVNTQLAWYVSVRIKHFFE
jgi:hypothetical protein